jgi:hypothetical protein
MFKVGEAVAVMPKATNAPMDVMAIETVKYVDQQIVELSDGRLFRADGEYLNRPAFAYIVPANDSHYSSLGRPKPR